MHSRLARPRSCRQRRVRRKTRVAQRQNPDDRGDAVLCPARSDPHDAEDMDGDVLQDVDPHVPSRPGTGSRPFLSRFPSRHPDRWKWRRVLQFAEPPGQNPSCNACPPKKEGTANHARKFSETHPRGRREYRVAYRSCSSYRLYLNVPSSQ